MSPPLDLPRIRVTLNGIEVRRPTLTDTGLFLNDFSTLYELARLAVDPRYDHYQISRFSLYRHSRPLREDDRLHVSSIRQESPLEVAAVIAAYGAAAGTTIGALRALAQLVGYVYNFPLNRQKLKLEVDKLAREHGRDPSGPRMVTPDEAVARLEARAYREIMVVARRLSQSPIQLSYVDVELESRQRPVDSTSVTESDAPVEAAEDDPYWEGAAPVEAAEDDPYWEGAAPAEPAEDEPYWEGGGERDARAPEGDAGSEEAGA